MQQKVFDKQKLLWYIIPVVQNSERTSIIKYILERRVIVFKQDKKIHKLKYWRQVARLTQEDFSVLLGCNRSNYCQKENGAVEITRSEMLKIQTKLNERLVRVGKGPVTLDEIFLP